MQGMDELFKLISQKLGVALNIVQQHGMEYILKYGHYDFITGIPKFLFIGLALAIFIMLIMVVFDFNNSIIAIVSIIVFFTPLIIHCINYYASPEIYSIKVVYQLLH